MSGRYGSHKTTSRKSSNYSYRVESPKYRKRKNSNNKKKKHVVSKTPPLPPRLCMEELLKKRESLQDKINEIEKCKDLSTKKNNENKRKVNNEHPTAPSKKPKILPEIPSYHSESEDEENIIEQRRLQRKQLLEKFKEPKLPTVVDKKITKTVSAVKEGSSFQKTNTNKSSESDNSTTDMFSDKDNFVHKDAVRPSIALAEDESSQLNDNWDDPDGYYNIREGDVLRKRFMINKLLGQGVFANVVCAHDIKDNNHVAIKIVRSNNLMFTTSLKEISILKEITEADPDNKNHCVKFFGQFLHRGHLCIILEPLHMDLRAVLKKYGRNHGINLKALISYTRQLLTALNLLTKIGVIHADIKPDNILVNEKKTILKLCDFGSAVKISENEPTPYLVSRFYRAPEIILGIAYNHAIDIWAAACTIYELATGKILFTGGSNNKMIKCFIELKGRIPAKLIKRGKFKHQHFNCNNNNFMLHQKDEYSGRDKVLEITNYSIHRDLMKELMKSHNYWTPTEEKKIVQLKDLLDKMLTIDYTNRLNVTNCLKHPFVQNQVNADKP